MIWNGRPLDSEKSPNFFIGLAAHCLANKNRRLPLKIAI